MKRLLASILAILMAGAIPAPGRAEDDRAISGFGNDVFRAGRTVSHDAGGTDDLFMAGERVTATSDITGSVHMAGRVVTMQGAVGGDAYVAGEEIEMRGRIAGDASIAGRAVSVAAVGGDLRIAGSEVKIGGTIGGYAIVAGEDVAFDAAVTGDVSLVSKRVDWGDAARIAGRLYVYEDSPGTLEVPGRVIDADRIERRRSDDWDGPERPSLGRAVASFLLGVVVVAGLAALTAALLPERLADLRRRILARPARTLWLGFLTQSAVVGAGLILALTLIGMLLTPAFVLLALLGGFAGYVVAAYAFGVAILIALGHAEPDGIRDRAIAAAVGAGAAGVIGLIPFLGWLFVLALVLLGIGALSQAMIRPAFFTDTA